MNHMLLADLYFRTVFRLSDFNGSENFENNFLDFEFET